jgi:hypothetical protein
MHTSPILQSELDIIWLSMGYIWANIYCMLGNTYFDVLITPCSFTPYLVAHVAWVSV